MNFLILGSGGREVGIAKKLKESDKYQVGCVSSYMNKQMNDLVDKYYILEDIYNTYKLRNLIINITPKIVIIGSEKFLEMEIVDLLLKYKIKCVGPNKKLADIELSKTFTRNFLSFNNLNQYNPKYEIIYNKSEDYLNQIFSDFNYDFVVKDDGLCSGKGVKLFNNQNYKLAFSYVKEILDKSSDVINDSRKCIVEEKLYGEEYVLMSFCDGKNIKHMPIVKDFKKIKLGSDVNTGSMGCIVQSDLKLPFLTEENIEESQNLNSKVMKLLSKSCKFGGYKGILYGSFMKTSLGIKLIEYNARFGDPECLVIFDILKTDLGIIFNSIVNEDLDNLNIEYENKNVICKYLVPPGYPDFPNKNIIFNLADNNSNIFQAGLKYENNNLMLTGSRTLAILKKGNNFKDTYEMIESEIFNIKDYLFYREDIGKDYCTNHSLYSESGVNIEEGNKVVEKIKSLVMSTYNEYVIGNWGDFGGLFDINKYIKNNNIEESILINSMDGVGTKSILAIQVLGVEEGLMSLGQDIVNHSVNDIIVKGGKPLYFSDYVASDVISSDNMVYLIKGMTEACKQNDCVLIGGETAEMPSVYRDGHFDIVGNITGILDKRNIIDGKRDIEEGDCIFGLLSEGPQTNGYSLIRYILDSLDDITEIDMKSLVRVHKSFFKDINEIRNKCKINGLCHITGGGFYDNLPRVLPNNLAIEIEINILEPFSTLMKLGNVSKNEMLRVFNCGYGMLIFVNKNHRDLLEINLGIKYLGKVTKKNNNNQILIK